MFHQFRLQQIVHGGRVTLKDKSELRRRLTELDGTLDRYLAGDYGIDADKKSTFQKWKASHQPFHWFVHFYGIMLGGGFDVIIGNPPYLEQSKLKGMYGVRGLRTASCRDIYAWVVERAFGLRAGTARLGLIVPVSIASSGSFTAARDIVSAGTSKLWLSHFANRPGQLFAGAQNRLTILLSDSGGDHGEHVYSTRYHRWFGREGERDSLLSVMRYTQFGEPTRSFHRLYSKVGAPEAASILMRTLVKRSIGEQTVKQSNYLIYWVRVPGYFCQFFIDPPKARPEKGGPARLRGELNDICTSGEVNQRILHALLNSSTYYQFFAAYTDGRHINPSDVVDFPLDLDRFEPTVSKNLVLLSRRLEAGMRKHLSQSRKSGLLIDSVDSRAVKPILDEIDEVLAKHYGFTDEELDFIINYDIKYRVGAEDDSDEE